MILKNEPHKFKKHLFLLHLIAAANFVYAFYFDFVYVHFPADFHPDKHTTFGGKFKYLTVLNLVIYYKVQVQCQLFFSSRRVSQALKLFFFVNTP